MTDGVFCFFHVRSVSVIGHVGFPRNKYLKIPNSVCVCGRNNLILSLDFCWNKKEEIVLLLFDSLKKLQSLWNMKRPL